MPTFYNTSMGESIETPNQQILGALSEKAIQAFAGDESRQLRERPEAALGPAKRLRDG